MILKAVDPGTEMSAMVSIDEDGKILDKQKMANELLLSYLRNDATGALLVIERIASYGRPVGQEVFDTCVWIGRYQEAWRGKCELMFRKDVKMHLCGSVAKIKDANIRQRLIDIYSGNRGDKVAIGVKASPGPLYKVTNDNLAALALAVTFAETKLGWTIEGKYNGPTERSLFDGALATG